MLAVLGEVPPGRDDDYAYEIKWDGIRLISYVKNSTVRAFTRNDRDVTTGYPELQQLITVLDGRECVLDGEIVAFNAERVVNFGTLQQRMHVADPAAVRGLVTSVPVVYVLFDLLSLDGKLIINQPYEQRRTALTSLGLAAPSIQVPPAIDGTADHALAVSAHMRAEGIVAKRLGSPYLPGRRSPDWLKIKHQRMQEVVIGGWRPGAGNRHGRIGALLVGVPGPDGLRYAGRVGTGFTDTALTHLAEQLEPLATETSPFIAPLPREVTRDAHWVQPALVGEVRYGEWTSEGILRHPAWRGLRPDKRPSDIAIE
ncbi:MAG: non-homologous end-joining DNA ligase [Pseudomonas fluorescens]